MTSEEMIQINNEAVPENTKKATKFGLAVKFICQQENETAVFTTKIPYRDPSRVGS